MLGTLLQDRFRLLRVIGQGGMGIVYEAEDERRGHKVALKTVDVSKAAVAGSTPGVSASAVTGSTLSAESIALLKREFRAASSIRHPNIVRFYDLVVSPSECFFTMEFISGENIVTAVRGWALGADEPTAAPTRGDLMERRGAPVVWVREQGATYDNAKLLSFLSQLGAALDGLHQAGVVHRDIKPHNVLVSFDGTVKLIDLGVVQPANPYLNATGVIEGTPHYMSPEQVRGERVTEKSDLYSLGVLLYVLLTGQPPFEGHTGRQLLRRHLETPPPPPSALARGVIPELESLCLSLLEKSPAKRPTARQAIELLVELGAPAPLLPKARARRFIGRVDELLTIEEISSAVEAGERRAVLVLGDSGAGKSHLCDEVEHVVSRLGWSILSGRCYERESIPYNAIDPWIEALVFERWAREEHPVLPAGVDALATMFPAVHRLGRIAALSGDIEPAKARQVAMQALGSLMSNFASPRRAPSARTAFEAPPLAARPMLLRIDDLQWADEDSLLVLEWLLERCEQPFLLLGTRRSTGRGLSIERSPHTKVLTLQPLSVREIAALLGADAKPEQVEQVSHESRGNAYLASELATSLLDGGSAALSSMLEERRARLFPAARTVLDLCVASGAALTFEMAQRLTGFSSAVLSESLDALCYVRLLSSSGGGHRDSYDIYHDQIRETLYRALQDDARFALHRKLAEALQEESAPEVIAGHLLRANEKTAAAEWYYKAAQRAFAQLAPLRASQLFKLAAEVGGPTWPGAKKALTERADLLVRAGGLHIEAAAAYREASSFTTGIERGKLLVQASVADLRSGEIEAAIQAGKNAMEPYGGLELPSSTLAALAEAGWRTAEIELRLWRLSGTPTRRFTEEDELRFLLSQYLGGSLGNFDLTRSMVVTMRGLSLALRAGGVGEIATALSTYVFFKALSRGEKNLETARSLYERANAWRSHGLTRDTELWLDTIPGILALFEGKFAGACDLLETSLERYRREGFFISSEVALSHAYLSQSYLGAGHPMKGIAHLAPMLQRASEAKDLISLCMFIPNMVALQLAVGDFVGIEATRLLVPEAAKARVSPTKTWLQVSEVAYRMALGEPVAAKLEEMLSKSMESGLMFLAEQRMRAQLLLALALLAESKRTPAKTPMLQRAEKALRAVLATRDPVLSGPALRIQSLLRIAQGETREAIQLIEQAVKQLQATGEAYELAAALLVRGKLLRRPEDTKRAEEILQQGGFLDPYIRESKSWER